jgi:hypothetical protein
MELVKDTWNTGIIASELSVEFFEYTTKKWVTFKAL